MARHRLKNYSHLRSSKNRRSPRGQAITEYGAILAFVAVLVALTFSFTSGSVGPAVSKAFSTIVKNLNDMANTADSASS